MFTPSARAAVTRVKAEVQVEATGGTIFTQGDWRYHYFYSTGTITFTKANSTSYTVKTFLISGGEGGVNGSGLSGGDGGSGGGYTNPNFTIANFGIGTARTATVGAQGNNSSLVTSLGTTTASYSSRPFNQGYGAGAESDGSGGGGGAPISISDPWTGDHIISKGGGGGGGGGGSDGGVPGLGGSAGDGGGAGGDGGNNFTGGFNGASGEPNSGGGGGGGGGTGPSASPGSGGGAGSGIVIIAYKWTNN